MHTNGGARQFQVTVSKGLKSVDSSCHGGQCKYRSVDEEIIKIEVRGTFERLHIERKRRQKVEGEISI